MYCYICGSPLEEYTKNYFYDHKNGDACIVALAERIQKLEQNSKLKNDERWDREDD